MPTLFLSHSHKDDRAATALCEWLAVNGFDDVFVDHHSMAGLENWGEALRSSAGSARVVLCLVSGNWLTSHECFGEFSAAWYMGKRIIALFLPMAELNLGKEAEARLKRVRGEIAGIDLTPCATGNAGLDIEVDGSTAALLRTSLNAAGANVRIGLDPSFFAPNIAMRPAPYPGLASFGDEDADAALLYGRSLEIASTLEELRAMKVARDARPYVILGASGSGKSSLLKAGIIPRLRREAPGWLPLRAFRPGSDPLAHLADAIALTFADFGQAEQGEAVLSRLAVAWRQAAGGGGAAAEASRARLEDALEGLGRQLRAAAGRPDATLLISIDQAEELSRAEGPSADAAADYLRAALGARSSHWMLACTIRTDSFPELQDHPRFRGLEARCYDLRSMPAFRFDSVIEEPAKRYGVAVASGLVDELIRQAQTEGGSRQDALPLLSFALQRLWQSHADSGALAERHLADVGGLDGLIEDAAERALRGIGPDAAGEAVTVPLPPEREAVAASAFVPTLAGLNDAGQEVRHVVSWTNFSPAQQAILEHFVRWRLLVRRGGDTGGTIEVAHEALLRTWARFQSWLEPERLRLETLRILQVDASNWERNGRSAAFLSHRRERLAAAMELREVGAYARRLREADRDYIDACASEQRAADARRRRGKIAVGSLASILLLSGVVWWQQGPIREALHWHFTMEPAVLAAAEEAALPGKPLHDFKECGRACPVMRVIPAGSYVMGQKKRARAMTIAKPFAVSRFDITFAQWDECTNSGACPRAEDNRWGRGDLPVINVSFEDAKLYTAWLSRVTGKRYRLLSEAEFEYAARAGTTTAYFWGDEVGQGNANCTECGSRWDGERTAPVGSFKPNAFGLHEMLGNVWKWCEITWLADEGEQNENVSVQRGLHGRKGGALRGGSWARDAEDARSASRLEIHEGGYRRVGIGFRLARDVGG